MKRILLVGVWVLMFSVSAVLPQDATPAHSTLLIYSTVERLLSGDMANAVDVATVEADLTAFPPDWAVIGLGTTNQPMRNGELMPDGTVANLSYWWADPSSPTEADIVDIAPDAGTTEHLPAPEVDADPEFPFLALSVADPDSAIVASAQDVENVHLWLRERLEAEGVTLAGLQLEGAFGEVRTTVAYNIPLTGLDLSAGYVGADYFRFGVYDPANWRMNGLYAADDAMQAVISTPGNAVHLHGYQPDTMLGGHITSAAALDVTVTIYPLAVIQQKLNEPVLEARG